MQRGLFSASYRGHFSIPRPLGVDLYSAWGRGGLWRDVAEELVLVQHRADDFGLRCSCLIAVTKREDIRPKCPAQIKVEPR